MLLFSLYDHDVLTCNDFGGEAFFPLKDVPGVVPRGRSNLGNFHGLKQVELALMFQENTGKLIIIKVQGYYLETILHALSLISDHPVLHVLSERQGDKLAQDFVKKQKKRFPSC